MLPDIVNLLNYLRYHISYRKSKIKWGAYIDNNSKVNEPLFVGSGSRVLNSRLGPNIIIKDYCIIDQCYFEKYVSVNRDSWLWDVKIGAYSYIAPRATISLVRIGKFCSIGPRLQCAAGDHPIALPSTSPIFFSSLPQCGITFSDKNYFDKEATGIVINNDVWIGSSVFIKDGVAIGDGAIIAAGAVVINNVPDYAVVGGVPAQLIRMRYPDETIQELLEIKWWNWPETKLRKAQKCFINTDISILLNWAKENMSQ